MPNEQGEIAIVDAEQCEGCGVCEEVCPMKAIAVEDDVAVVDLEKCEGCGDCVSACPLESIKMGKPEEAA